MDWLNEHSGLLIIICSVLIIALLAVTIYIVYDVRKKIASQKINFLGLYAIDPNTRVAYAKLTFGNKSINNLGITELGVKNGGVNFPFTAEFRAQHRLGDSARIIIEPRCAIEFKLSTDDLKKVIFEKNGKKMLKTLRLYAIDVAGSCYQGKVKAIKRLVRELMIAEEKGVPHTPTLMLPQPAQPNEMQPQSEQREETVVVPETPLETLARTEPAEEMPQQEEKKAEETAVDVAVQPESEEKEAPVETPSEVEEETE